MATRLQRTTATNHFLEAVTQIRANFVLMPDGRNTTPDLYPLARANSRVRLNPRYGEHCAIEGWAAAAATSEAYSGAEWIERSDIKPLSIA